MGQGEQAFDVLQRFGRQQRPSEDRRVRGDAPDADPARLVDAKLAFLADLYATLAFEGERIDVVLYSPTLHRTLLPVQREALTRGLELTG
jgi:hypothetical protein